MRLLTCLDLDLDPFIPISSFCWPLRALHLGQSVADEWP